MEPKTIVILAKSKKLGGYCIAGREVIEIAGDYLAGDWIRPVGLSGKIRESDCVFEDDIEAALLDIVKIPTIKHQPEVVQPENFLIDEKQYWSKVGTIQPSDLDNFVESPNSLWLREQTHSDYVSACSIASDPPEQSLYFIQPKSLCLNLYYWQRKRLKATFKYNSCYYELQVTDTLVWDRIRAKYPGQWEEGQTIELEAGDYYLCISLAGEWKANHYKLVAALINKKGRPIQ